MARGAAASTVNGRVVPRRARGGRRRATLVGRLARRAAGRVPFPRAAPPGPRGRRDLLVIDKPPGPAHRRDRARAGAHRLPPALGLPGGAAARARGRSSSIASTARRRGSSRSPSPRRRSAQLQAQFEARTAEREYVAVVEGRVPRRRRARSRAGSSRTATLRVRAAPSGKPAITHYQVLARRRDTTVLELSLGTGRRHQIRVQLADLGHPIVGRPRARQPPRPVRPPRAPRVPARPRPSRDGPAGQLRERAPRRLGIIARGSPTLYPTQEAPWPHRRFRSRTRSPSSRAAASASAARSPSSSPARAPTSWWPAARSRTSSP